MSSMVLSQTSEAITVPRFSGRPARPSAVFGNRLADRGIVANNATAGDGRSNSIGGRDGSSRVNHVSWSRLWSIGGIQLLTKCAAIERRNRLSTCLE
jgi:hypothetical protein